MLFLSQDFKRKNLNNTKGTYLPDCLHHDVNQQLVWCSFSFLEETISFWSQLRTSGGLQQDKIKTVTLFKAQLHTLVFTTTQLQVALYDFNRLQKSSLTILLHNLTHFTMFTPRSKSQFPLMMIFKHAC